MGWVLARVLSPFHGSRALSAEGMNDNVKHAGPKGQQLIVEARRAS